MLMIKLCISLLLHVLFTRADMIEAKSARTNSQLNEINVDFSRIRVSEYQLSVTPF